MGDRGEIEMPYMTLIINNLCFQYIHTQAELSISNILFFLLLFDVFISRPSKQVLHMLYGKNQI